MNKNLHCKPIKYTTILKKLISYNGLPIMKYLNIGFI